MTTTRLLLPDGWHDVSVLRWPPFHGRSGYAALTPAGQWLIGPTTAIHAVAVMPDTDTLADLIAATVEDLVAERQALGAEIDE